MTYSEIVQRYNELKAEGKSPSTSKKMAKVYNQMQDHPQHKLVSSIQNEIIQLDRQLQELGKYLSLTDDEISTIIEKAITEVQPYYDRKNAEIEAQLAEGKVRTAEEQLLTINEIEQETSALLESYDLSTAETEEDFLNRMGALTAQTEDEIAAKTEDFRQRFENVKMGQIQSGVFSSGIGGKKRAEEEANKQREIGATEERSLETKTQLESRAKYDLENVRLAREAAQQRRIREIGTPEETEAQRQEAMGILGGDVASRTAVEAARTQRGISPLYNKQALTDLEEEKRKSVLSRQEELKSQQLAERNTEYEQMREKILAERARKASQLQTYGI